MAEVLRIDGGSPGFTIEAREFRVSEENLATSPAAVRDGRVKTLLLEAVCQHVVDPGPYDAPGGRIDWDKVLHGDREVVLRGLRIATWGPDYFRDDPCPLCTQPTENWFDLAAFPVQKLPESSLEHVKTGKPLSAVLPRAKKRVDFRLRRGKDERELRKIRDYREDQIPQAFLELHVLAIEGIAPSDSSAFLAELGGLDSSFLRKQIDKADTGINQSGVWRCKCGHRWKKDVDFGSDFFFPEFREKTN